MKHTNIYLVVDASGSMQSFRSKVVDTFNKQVDTIRENVYRGGEDVSVSLSTFSYRDRIKEVYFNADAKTLKRWTLSDYYPDGQTALYDAVKRAVDGIKSVAKPDDANLVIIMTDGEENHSYTNSSTLMQVIRECQITDRWTFSFMVPPGYKSRLVRELGVPEGNVIEWEISDRGMAEVSNHTSQGLNNYFVARSVGKTSVKSFYTDLSKVSAKDLKKNLDDIQSEVKVWNVDGEIDIKSFCEQRSRKEYLKGAAFYALTKSETIQGNKNIIIMEKGKKSVYAGQDARKMLGLPNYGDAKVKPGNHANFDIFVQSTSVNRKLVRGTKLVYAPKFAGY